MAEPDLIIKLPLLFVNLPYSVPLSFNSTSPPSASKIIFASESKVNVPDVTLNGLAPALISRVEASNTASISFTAPTRLPDTVVRFSVIPTSSCNSLIASTKLGENILISSLADAGVFNSIT